jgi:hypothetical protein
MGRAYVDLGQSSPRWWQGAWYYENKRELYQGSTDTVRYGITVKTQKKVVPFGNNQDSARGEIVCRQRGPCNEGLF